MQLSNSIGTLRCVFLASAVWLGLNSAPAAYGADWITDPSYYSHDPQTGERVQQYSPIGPFYIYPRGDFRRSGYRQTRSSIQVGGAADHMHIVEEWGDPVRPYGEWRFPYRPYSVPYDQWGPPVPQVTGAWPGGYYGGSAHPGAGTTPRAGGFPRRDGRDPRFHAYPGYFPQPQDDGRYPPYDSEGPYGYPDLLQRPPRHRIELEP